MILNALDEVLFWDDIAALREFIQQNTTKYYPHNPREYYAVKNAFIEQKIPTKETFISKLDYYVKNGSATWVSGRNRLCDDIDIADMLKAITVSSRVENGQKKASQASTLYKNNPDFWNTYSENILHMDTNYILELTIGAGLGTGAVMKNMQASDYYMGVDIDFICAKNADALAQYYQVNGLGVATSLWNLPFEDEMFTSVCSNAGLEECREIPTILCEAVRVLKSGGRLTIHCIKQENNSWNSYFSKYGFTDEERANWLNRVNLFSDVDQVKETLNIFGLSLIAQRDDDRLGHIIVFEKNKSI